MMRLVSQELNNCLDKQKDTPANFGLMFNKYLVYDDQKIEPQVKVEKSYKSLIAQYKNSTRKKEAEKILKQRHLQQVGYCQAMKKAGYQPVIIHAGLAAPFVSGLGMDHPTETGMVLDYLSGLPYIPAAGQKGVMRLAYLVNSLKDEDGEWLTEDALAKLENMNFDREGNLTWQEDEESKFFFGATAADKARAGQVIILDAYPLAPPELGQEIMNPHYGDYYKGKCGPTEDQSPKPIKFLVVKPGVEFVFRFLLRNPTRKIIGQDMTVLQSLLEKTILQALSKEGIGAKTALGFGRFLIQNESEAPQVDTWLKEQEEEKYPWVTVIRQLNGLATDWNQLKQHLAGPEIKKFLDRKDVAGIIKNIAVEIRKKTKPDKWKPDRDKKIKAWLELSGLQWQEKKQEKGIKPEPAAVGNNVLLTAIEQLTSFKEYQQNKEIKINKLDKPCADALKFKLSAFKCKKAKKNTPEKKAWNQLLKRLKKLK